MAIWRGIGLIAVRFLLPVALLMAVAVGIAYVRLLNGPLALPFLTEPIARGINSELTDFTVRVEEAVVELRDDGSFEFRLMDVRLNNNSGQTVTITKLDYDFGRGAEGSVPVTIPLPDGSDFDVVEFVKPLVAAGGGKGKVTVHFDTGDKIELRVNL